MTEPPAKPSDLDLADDTPASGEPAGPTEWEHGFVDTYSIFTTFTMSRRMKSSTGRSMRSTTSFTRITRARSLGAAALGCFMALSAHAHVTVWPRESPTGEWEKYTVRVPTEGKIATSSVELQIPDDVYVVSMGVADGHRYELKKSGKRVVAIVWTRQIEPGEFAEFVFMARNPADAGLLVWKALQRYVDGSKTEWTGPVGDRTPAPVTKLVTAPDP
jgi:uncharacterized protein YcnI